MGVSYSVLSVREINNSAFFFPYSSFFFSFLIQSSFDFLPPEETKEMK